MTTNHGWQPIETAPRDGTEILAWGSLSREQHLAIVVWQKLTSLDGWWWVCQDAENYGWSNYKPTHWQTLPDPPKERRDA